MPARLFHMQNPCSLPSLVDGVENLKVRLNVCQSIGVEKVFFGEKVINSLRVRNSKNAQSQNGKCVK